ncbi:uncharacterized protein TEOVI_000049100 [Trypanosoma equiperdum]|uniref:Uncharacterized protein n=1 Tax=Trypanosoma equiperdum TaxID=5694 RepID=A0A1G4I881_TRYEQ|nr:hypothetical protein, conserved [Trypanosoma equiperdum]
MLLCRPARCFTSPPEKSQGDRDVATTAFPGPYPKVKRSHANRHHGTTRCGGTSALDAAELSRLCLTLPVLNAEEHHAARKEIKRVPLVPGRKGYSSDAEEKAITYLLNHCRFPTEDWWTSLSLLARWRELPQQKLLKESPLGTSALFPRHMSMAASSQLMRCLSYTKHAWVDVLTLYETTTRNSAVLGEVHDVKEDDKGKSCCSDVSHQALRWMRHVALTSLLSIGRWKESLQFYRHMLYQREMPSYICTGHLIQRLGEVGRWEPVCNIFSISLKILKDARERAPAKKYPEVVTYSSQQMMSRGTTSKRRSEWGTMFSMALDVVCRLCHQPYVAKLMFDQAYSMNGSGVLFQWDGNFLSAVQALHSERERADMLCRARAAGQLDSFKLVRGLNHHQKWLDAIAIFAEAVETGQLTKREVGQCRLNILHASNVTNIQGIVSRIQEICKRSADSLLLNDAEVECVFSKHYNFKTFSNASVPMRVYTVVPHWLFCLRLLSYNYPRYLLEDDKVPRTGQKRLPNARMMSLLLRHSMPWTVAIRLLTIALRLGEHSNTKAMEATSDSPSAALMVNHVAEILYAQGQRARAISLLDSVSHRQSLSPSAKMLECIPLTMLTAGGKTKGGTGLKVDNKVIYHYIQTTTNWMRALSVIEAVVYQRSSSTNPLASLPASVHCSVLQMLQRCSLRNAWLLSFFYFKYSMSAVRLLDKKQGTVLCHDQPHLLQKEDLRNTVYSVMYETLLNILKALIDESDKCKENACFELVSAVMTFCGGRVPAHMLLPNQMDRLLPRAAGAFNTVHNVELRVRIGLKLVQSVIELLSKEVKKQRGNCRDSDVLSLAVMFHGLQKLLCRGTEHNRRIRYTDELLQLGSPQPTPHMGGRGTIMQGKPTTCGVEDSVLWRYSLELLALQCEWCGTCTMAPGTLKLVYRTCAYSGGQWGAALLATQYILMEQQRDTAMKGPVGPDNCSLYCSLFGWEKALGFWSLHFPHRALSEVLPYPKGVDYCMSDTER